MSTHKPTCGRCGVYRDLHPTTHCAKPRLSFWWDRHQLVRHVAGILWASLSDQQRLSICKRLHDRRPDLCWCDFVFAALIDTNLADYRGANGCGCDVPLPTDARPPRPGWCYCGPAEVDVTNAKETN